MQLEYMDPASRHVMIQSKLITTAILWSFVFKTKLGKKRWIAIIFLCIGGALVGLYKKSINLNNLLFTAKHEEQQSSMYVIWPMGPLLVLLQAILSGIAGVYCEWLYKNGDSKLLQSIHAQNIIMYIWGLFGNIIQFIITSKKPISQILDGTATNKIYLHFYFYFYLYFFL